MPFNPKKTENKTMALLNYFQGLFLSFGLLDYALINLNGDYDLVILGLRLSILQTRILPVSQFLYDFFFEKRLLQTIL